MAFQKKHVAMITDIVKELVNAGIDKLAATYIPTETETKKRKHRKSRGRKETNKEPGKSDSTDQN